MAADPAQFRLLPVKGVNLDVPITVLANRPDLRAAEYRLQASQQSVNAQKRSWYPSITLGASLSTSSDKAKARSISLCWAVRPPSICLSLIGRP